MMLPSGAKYQSVYDLEKAIENSIKTAPNNVVRWRFNVVSCTTGVFVGYASVFVRVIAIKYYYYYYVWIAVLNRNKRRRWGESPSEYPMCHNFYSPQSSSVIKSKVAVTALKTFARPKVTPACSACSGYLCG